MECLVSAATHGAQKSWIKVEWVLGNARECGPHAAARVDWVMWSV